MAKQNSTRTVKLHSKYRALTRSWNYSPGKTVPWLNVSGLWLEHAGFNIGDAVEITVEEKTLIIKNIAADGDTSH
jgi:toxic protein SymE